MKSYHTQKQAVKKLSHQDTRKKVEKCPELDVCTLCGRGAKSALNAKMQPITFRFIHTKVVIIHAQEPLTMSYLLEMHIFHVSRPHWFVMLGF